MTDAAAQARAQAAIDAIHRDYATVFGSEEGQRVLRHIEATSYVHQTTAVPGDTHGTYCHEGIRIAYLNIVARIERGRLVGAIEEPRTVTPSIPHEESP